MNLSSRRFTGHAASAGVLLLIILSFAGPELAAAPPARIWEQTITLPTYKVASPDVNPRFYSGRTYQGAKATFYPYPVSDQMTDKREDQQYKAVYLENQYIQMSVLPELGGRIFTAMDKGNGYDFFYRQHVIKPALIGMLGAWISGGVEWNVPHHHRASSFMPVDYVMQDGPDGAKTLWVGETELRHRMKWMVGLTVRPDHSYIQMDVKLFNRTPSAQSFLFWINPAVHANTNYQVIFPPSTEWAVQHAKPEFASWPVAHQVYGGVDYTRGVDISWWKNHPSPVSFFAFDCQEDFFGGYDHGKEAGVIQISNHHVSPGKKFFEWGNGPEGEMWTKILSDEDGPYLELMAGSYSDNQPDYSWVQPGEVKTFTHFWYPVRKLGGIKDANTEAAVNLECGEGKARLAFNTTAAHPKAKVVLRGAERVLFEKQISISPREPFVAEIPLPQEAVRDSLKAELLDAKGTVLVSYQPAPKANSPMPKPVKRPVAPKDIASLEELYLTGLRIEQLYSPAFDPVPYYKEALRRDEGDYRANTALASLYCRQGRFAEAEPLLKAAISRATENYIRPKDGEAFYYLGVACRAQDKLKEAKDAFYKSIWSKGWQGAGYFALAELASLEGDYTKALALVEKSLQNGALNTKALELKASLLRKSDRKADARNVARQVVAADPLNARAACEFALCEDKGRKQSEGFAKMHQLMRGQTSAYLELAVDYANAGLFPEAVRVLESSIAQSVDGGVEVDPHQVNPLVFYYIADFAARMGDTQKVAIARSKAAQMPPEFCFPFQHEAEGILLRAIKRNPTDARAQYYLGELLFDNQPERAIECWQKAATLEPGCALAHRNLGFGLAQARKDVPNAIKCMEQAVALVRDNSRMYYELDVLYEAAGAPVEQRLQAMSRRPEAVAQRDDAVTRRIQLLTASGDTDQALKILGQRQFHNWEGSGALHDVYVDACLREGLTALQKQNATGALASFEKARQYPANQQVGKPKREQRVAQLYYCAGLALEALGRKQDATASYERAASTGEYGSAEAQCYRAMALLKTGRNEEAKKVFADMERRGLADLEREADNVDYFAKFGEKRAERLRKSDAHFTAGLGCAGLNKPEEAANHFAKALELHPGHLGAQTWRTGLIAIPGSSS